MAQKYEPYTYGVLNFLRHQLFTHFELPKDRLDGKTIIVTGSNVGLGFEAAKAIARMGASRLILAVRSIAKGEAAVKEIQSTLPPDSKTSIEVWPLVMDNYQSVIDFTERANRLDRLDVLLANAGISNSTWDTSDGEEMHIKVNVIGTFLLSIGLLPKLRETGIRFGIRTHLEVVSSELHAMSSFKEWKSDKGIYEELSVEQRADLGGRYATSKLMQVLLVRQLAQLSPLSDKSPVIINTVNPGMCYSNINKSTGVVFVLIEIVKFLLARSTIQGAITLVAGIVAGDKSHGEYCSECLIRPPSNFVLSEEGQQAQQALWDQTIKRLEQIQSGISSRI